MRNDFVRDKIVFLSWFHFLEENIFDFVII